jgi:hemolysin activation/secretion protein
MVLIGGIAGAQEPPSGAQEPPTVTFTVDRFVVEGENPLDAGTTQSVLAPFVGEYSGLDGLLAAADALQGELANRGYSFHRVVLPPQTLEGGAVTLRVVTFTIADVKVEGNRHYSADNVRASVPVLVSGVPPNTRALSRALSVANQHPRKRVRVNLSDSATQEDAVDAVIDVRDERPYQFFSGLNNIGTDEPARLRWSIGAQYANLWNRDHVVTATFTTAPEDFDDVQQFGINYQIPIYRFSGWLSAFYVTSDVDIGAIQDIFDVSGAGDFVGVNYTQQLMSIGRYRQSWSIGLQDRAFDTSIFSTGTGAPIPGISTEVRSRPFTVRYDANYAVERTAVGFFVDYTRNWVLGGHNRDIDYEAVRPGAEDAWDAVRFGAQVSHLVWADWQVVGRLTGQWSGEPLIPGEQFGLGGERSVRGFEERALAGDDAFQFSGELWTPAWRELAGMRFVGFTDIGYKHLYEPEDPQRANDTVASIGLGARWQWEEQLLVSVDYGYVLGHARGEASDEGNVKWHFNIQYRY